MARRNTRIAVPAGPDWTELFRAAGVGGADGAPAKKILITCHAQSASACEYQVVDDGRGVADPPGEAAELQPGEAVVLIDAKHVRGRGVGGAGEMGSEVIHS